MAKKKKENDKDHALWLKFDNISKDESTDLLSEIIKSKDKIAPDARGTFAKGKKKELPSEIKKALLLEDKDNG